MQSYKLKFRNRPLLEQLTHCERHVENISLLPVEQRVQVDLPQVTASVGAARASFDLVESLRSQLKAEVTRRNELMRAARVETERAVGFVALNTGMQPAAMLAAGLDLKAAKSPVGLPGMVTEFTVKPDTDEGIVRLKWKRPLRRCVFTVQFRTEGETGWKDQRTIVATKHVIPGLKSGVKYWFRVCAVNAHGSGPWSQPVSARVK
jgi:hypothetical protein